MDIFRLATARMDQIPYIIFHTTSQFFLSIASPFSFMTHYSSVIF